MFLKLAVQATVKQAQNNLTKPEANLREKSQLKPCLQPPYQQQHMPVHMDHPYCSQHQPQHFQPNEGARRGQQRLQSDLHHSDRYQSSKLETLSSSLRWCSAPTSGSRHSLSAPCDSPSVASQISHVGLVVDDVDAGAQQTDILRKSEHSIAPCRPISSSYSVHLPINSTSSSSSAFFSDGTSFFVQGTYIGAGRYDPQPPSTITQTPRAYPIGASTLGDSLKYHHHYISWPSQYKIQQTRACFICQSCGKSFSRPSGLNTHLNSHTGEKPFKCPYIGCRKAFSVRSNMKRHQLNCYRTFADSQCESFPSDRTL